MNTITLPTTLPLLIIASGIGRGGPGGQLPPFFADLVDEFSYY